MTATLPSYDLFTPEAADNSLGLLQRISTASPVSWIPALGAYLVTRHEDVLAALRDHRFTATNATQVFSQLSAADQEELAPVRLSIDLWMRNTSLDDHKRFKQLLLRYFTPATVNGLRPHVRELTNELLDAVTARGSMEVLRDLAFPLPASIIGEMFGMPVADRDRLRGWSQEIAAIFLSTDIARLRAAQHGVLEMQDYLRAVVAARRADPRDDLISMFVAAERDGLVTEDEIVANCVLLLFAGHDTTAGLLAKGVAQLLDHPGQLELLKSRPELTASAVEEMLRYDGPSVTVIRESLEPVRLAGHDFAAGTSFYLSVWSANRDPAVFDDPLTFDITRQNNRHLAFGLGAYYCLGAALARVEADECFRILLDRMPGLRPGGAPVVSRVMPLGHRLDSLPVLF